MGSLVYEDSLKKTIMSSIDTLVEMFLILEHERGGRAVSLHLQNLVKLLYRLACRVLSYSQIEIFQKA